MSDSFPQAIVELLWRDTQAPNDFPDIRPLLAHYTTVSTLEKIVQGEELWFSNPLFMNDWEELEFGMNLGAQVFRTHADLEGACETPENHRQLLDAFSRLFDDFDRNHAIDTYVLCLAEHDSANEDGALSMWRGYGANGNGVALVIDTSRIRPTVGSPFIAARVVYASHLERQEWMVRTVDRMAELLRQHGATESNLISTAHYFFERLKLFSLFTKHNGFHEEREWRIVYFSQKDHQRLLAPMIGYSLSAKGVEPKLKLHLPRVPPEAGGPISLEEIVAMVLLGPSLSTVVSGAAVRRMLALLDKKSLAARVRASSIPYRA